MTNLNNTKKKLKNLIKVNNKMACFFIHIN